MAGTDWAAPAQSLRHHMCCPAAALPNSQQSAQTVWSSCIYITLHTTDYTHLISITAMVVIVTYISLIIIISTIQQFFFVQKLIFQKYLIKLKDSWLHSWTFLTMLEYL